MYEETYSAVTSESVSFVCVVEMKVMTFAASERPAAVFVSVATAGSFAVLTRGKLYVCPSV